MMDSHVARVRPAEFQDAERIARVHVNTWRETYSGLIPDSFFNEDAFSTRKDMWTRYLFARPLPGRLVVARENHRARAFYERNGFEYDGVEFIDPRVRDLVELRLVR